jgi:glycosyltransferase involved in cell wall biosynthesis
MKKVLYISYDGMTDQLGQSQVLPYLVQLASKGYEFTLVSFEKKERYNAESQIIEDIARSANINWVPLWFTRKPPLLSKMYDIWQLHSKVKELHRKHKFDLVHCRSYVAAGAGLSLKRKYGVKFLFDMRGFWVDERIDNDQWDLKNPLHKLFYKRYKKKEKAYFSESDHIVSLTEKGKEELVTRYQVPASKISVIPCCVDLTHFDYEKIQTESIDSKRKELGLKPNEIIISYLGSLGGWYLVKEMLEFFSELKKNLPAAKFLFVTRDDPRMIFELAAQSGVLAGDIIVKSASRAEVPLFLAISQWNIFFIKDAYSKRASSPTKQGEIMAMGVPIICNDIGDTGRIIEATGTGLLVRSFDQRGFQLAMDALREFPVLEKQQIRKAAFEYYDLQKGVLAYLNIYKSL